MALHRAGPVPPPIFIIGHMRPRIEACLHSIHDYSKSTYAFSKESVARVIECWRPFVTRFGYNPPDLERRAA